MRHLACCFILSAFPAAAQITLVDSVPGDLVELRTLRTAGQKLMEYPVSTYPNVNIYNTDLTPYVSFTVPAPPPGFSYNVFGYFSEDLFDTDPTTIEYMAMAYASPPVSQQVFVYREDGTVLAAFDPGNINFNSHSGLSWGPIFNTSNGPVMIVRRAFSGQSVLVSLPGTLPCMDCSGVIMFSGDEDRIPTAASMNAFPNPATNAITVQYTLPAGTNGHALLYDALGAEVRRVPLVTKQGTVEIITTGLPTATYRCEVVAADGQHLGASIVVVD